MFRFKRFENNPKTYHGTLLHIGALLGHVDVVKYLFEWAVPKNPRDNYGCMPIHYAAQSGDLATIEFLYQEGDAFKQDNEGWMPIHYAAFFDQVEICKYLVDQAGHGIYINTTTNDSKTPLELAVSQDNLDVIAFIEEVQLELFYEIY